MRISAEELAVALESDLLDSGWDGQTSLYPGITRHQALLQSQAKALLKKYVGRNTPKAADEAALSLFKESNTLCAEFRFPERLTEAETIALGEAKEFIHRFFYPDECGDCIVNLSSISANYGVGNGSNIGAVGVDFYSKVATSYATCTSPALHQLYVQSISHNPLWSETETFRSSSRGVVIDQRSRLSFVPKTREVSRTICTEPILNMIFQKGIGDVITERLEQQAGLSLKHQPDNNRLLARLGSETGEFGTIDLSCASDSISLTLVQAMLPRMAFSWLNLTRCPQTVLPDGEVLDLHMVSSMGNAFTFPLQTMLFCSLVYGAYRVMKIPFIKPHSRRPNELGKDELGNFAVFGDDIIVRRDAYRFVCRLLEICGFRVNVDKSFNDGFFRESCGSDFWSGHDIRSVYIKRLLDASDVYSAINRLNRWSVKHRVPLTRAVSYLAKHVRKNFVPFREDDAAGIKVPLCYVPSVRISKRYLGGYSYRALVINPKLYDVSDVSLSPPKKRGWIHNSHGLLLAILAGTVRAGKISDRITRRSFRLQVRHSPCWDWALPGDPFSDRNGDIWKDIVGTNLLLERCS